MGPMKMNQKSKFDGKNHATEGCPKTHIPEAAAPTSWRCRHHPAGSQAVGDRDGLARSEPPSGEGDSSMGGNALCSCEAGLGFADAGKERNGRLAARTFETSVMAGHQTLATDGVLAWLE
mmetsp:Transcript_23220/g.37325  ORF Transcript_23220/g.37325 Transcript_23220/m.37325 type:complete len:120 (+) Transcript_23220:1430-1789(+)